MADVYSVEIHAFISQKIGYCKKEISKADRGNDVTRKKAIEGQLLELHFFRQYLTDNIDLKNKSYF